MEFTFKLKPKIRVSYDEMEAYLLLPFPMNNEKYTFSEVRKELELANVSVGVDYDKITEMLKNNVYDKEILIAKGTEPVQGVDAYYEFYFDTNFNKQPTHRADGSVDYWSIHSVEVVEAGKVIAAYIEPIEGSNGMTVKGKVLTAKKGRPLPQLTGKGFTRSADNKTYTAALTGKIEMQGNRILIAQVHEVFGDVGLKTGNIDFRGDVIIHGNVPTGAVIKATGSITIDGAVEGAILEANKNIIIRGGMMGAGKGLIRTKGDLNAKFLEYTTVTIGGDLTTDALINCNVTADGKVLLQGKHASIIGGVIYAATGVEAYTVGNEYGIKTEIYTGINTELKKQIVYHEHCIKEAQDMIDKINTGLQQLNELLKMKADAQNEQRKAALVRTKIVKQADLAAHIQQLNAMSQIVENAQGVDIKVLHEIYAGGVIGINDAVVQVKDSHQSVVFHERENHIGMFSMRAELI